MKTAIKYTLIIILGLCVIATTEQFVGRDHYLVIAFGTHFVQFRVVTLIVGLLLCFLVFYVCIRIFSKSFAFSKSLRRLMKGGHYKKQSKFFYNGLFALALGNNEKAKAAMEKVTSDDFHGFHYIALGQLALQEGKFDLAMMWFDKAKQHRDPACVNCAVLLSAQTLLQQNEPQDALKILDSVDNQKDADLIKLRAQVLAKTNQWQALENELPKWKKLLGDDVEQFNSRIATNKFAEIASKEGANQLKAHWQTLGRQQRNDDDYRAAYLQELLHQGMHVDALNHLVDWYKKKPVPLRYINVIKQIQVAQPASLIQTLENSIKAFPQEACYYAALGHVAYRSGDYSLSKKALMKAVELNKTEAELLLLAQLFETTGDYQQAIQAMRNIHALRH
jgi:HemY protein